jgi:hypothetical protein
MFSEQWSYYLAERNAFKHSGNALYGENLAYFQGYVSDIIPLLKKAVDNWYNEGTLYDYSNPGFSEATGHFTCLVWLASTDIGIGYTYNPATKVVIITMNTSPPGNVEGQFVQNVLPSSTNVPAIPPTVVISKKPDILFKINTIILNAQQSHYFNMSQYKISDLIHNIQTYVSNERVGNMIDILNYVLILIRHNQNRNIIVYYLNIVRSELMTIDF